MRDRLHSVTSGPQQWINLGIFVMVGAGLCTLVFGKKGRRLWKRVLLGTAESVAFFAFAYWGFPYLNLLLDEYESVLQSMEVRFLLALLVISLGAGAHVFKKKNKLRYGQSEVIVGILSACSVANGMTPGQPLFSHWVALAGAAYVVARGLNNWSEELEEHGNRYGHRSIKQNVLAWIYIEEKHQSKESQS
jgi:hypothetical protein